MKEEKGEENQVNEDIDVKQRYISLIGSKLVVYEMCLFSVKQKQYQCSL